MGLPGGFPDKLPGEDFIHSWYPILIALVGGLIIGFRNYMKGPECKSEEKLKNKTVIITGANTGIGLETAKDLARRGARVILACRDEERSKIAVDEIKESVKKSKVISMKLDLSSFKSVRQFVEDFKENEDRLDILINNAGVMCHPQTITEDGVEVHFQVNYLGHFLLTHLLLDELKDSAPARIVNVCCMAYRIGDLNLDDINRSNASEYKGGEVFSQSKMAVVMGTRHLSKQLEGTNVTVNVANPGIVNTEHHRHMPFMKSAIIRLSFYPVFWFFTKRALDGAQTLIQCAVGSEEKDVSGQYYSDCQVGQMDQLATDEEKAQKLWDMSMKLCKLD